MTTLDPRLRRELEWLKDNPAFDERPATLPEFLGPQYLNIEDRVRKRIRYELTEIMGDEVSGERIAKHSEAIVTGGIGIGKTTIASIVLPYLCHWMLCLRDPQGFFNLLPGSRIAFMQMSTSENQAREVVFGDIFARVKYSPWFTNKYPYDPKFTKQIRFPKDIWILPGDSAETTFEGYNIFGGILDEADSHKVTKNKDYAEAGYDTIHARVTSRFGDRGFALVIGQMKHSQGFAARKYEEFQRNPRAYAVRMAIWDSFGMDSYEKDEDGNVKTFWYDSHRKMIVPSGAAALSQSSNLIEIPEVYRQDFTNSPEKALRDLAGIPPVVGDPFISLPHKIEEARDRWLARHPVGESPVTPEGRLEKWFRAPDSIKRVAHIDLAFSSEGDALGFAMGHVRGIVDVDGEMKPYIIFDMLLRMKAPPGGEIFLGNVRHLIYSLRDALGFKLEYVSMDGFESTDTKQQFRRRRIASEIVSIDRDLLPYHDLREAIYEDRVEFPPYMVKMNPQDVDLVEVAYRELTELIDEGAKIDHPLNGSKDVSDAMAGVVTKLMGDRTYHRKTARIDTHRQPPLRAAAGLVSHPAFVGDVGVTAPIPPTDPRKTWG